VAGFEALVRWQLGDELVTADEIVPIAEDTGLILSIGLWVLRESLRQLAAWQRINPAMARLDMHVNLSAKQFLQPNLLEQVADALADSGVVPQRLHLEVTESVIIDNPGEAAALLERLRETGVRISLDDFGTGYSSLSSLSQFPFDTLKIDRSFISTNGDRRNDEIVRTISNLARILGMDVTVEGLESAGQVGRMRELGIEFAQGFFFSPPVDAETAIRILAGEIPNPHASDGGLP
jgi:EAL domain-containing protein (putative c-di-GMP-specific phosphodiesterase class I)